MSYRPPDNRNITIGRGKVLLAAYDTPGGTLGHYRPGGNYDQVDIQVEEQSIRLNSSMDEDGGVLAENSVETTVTATIRGHERDIRQLAMAVMGAESDYVQTATTATQSLAAITLGGIYQLDYRSVSSVVVTQGTATLTTAADYRVLDDEAGLIEIYATATTATAGATLSVEYVAAAITAGQMLATGAGTDVSKTYRFLFLPRNVRGQQYEHVLWEGRVKPGGPLPLVQGQEYGTHQLILTALKRDDLDAEFPYHRAIQRASASDW